MNLEKKVNQLTELLSDLTRVADALMAGHRNTDNNINLLVQSQMRANNNINLLVQSQLRATKYIHLLVQYQSRTSLAKGELRQSNMRLADSMEKLTKKIDKVDELETRLKKIENKLFRK